MRNSIELIYVDDNGLDYHVRIENLNRYANAGIEQEKMVRIEAPELLESLCRLIRRSTQSNAAQCKCIGISHQYDCPRFVLPD